MDRDDGVKTKSIRLSFCFMVGFLGANGCFLLPSIEQNIPHFYEKRDSESIFKIFIKKKKKRGVI
jgi:hypothetical protein